MSSLKQIADELRRVYEPPTPRSWGLVDVKLAKLLKAVDAHLCGGVPEGSVVVQRETLGELNFWHDQSCAKGEGWRDGDGKVCSCGADRNAAAIRGLLAR